MEAAFGLGCDQRPVKRGKATQQDHLAKISSISTRRDPHRIAAISMLPDDDDGITCDSCDKDIKYVSGWRGRGEGRGCWCTIGDSFFFFLAYLQVRVFDNGRRLGRARVCVCVFDFVLRRRHATKSNKQSPPTPSCKRSLSGAVLTSYFCREVALEEARVLLRRSVPTRGKEDNVFTCSIPPKKLHN